MDEWITLTKYNWAYWIAGFFALVEFGKWVYTSSDWIVSKFGIETKNMRLKREYAERLKKSEESIEEIRNNTKKNVQMFTEHEIGVLEKLDTVSNALDDLSAMLTDLNSKYYDFSDRFEKHKKESYKINKDNDAVDRALLRDRLTGGLRYFNQNKDENGMVHISASDHENMSKMFQEYFNKNGNGTMKQRYENEFKHYVIDDQKYN